MPRLFEPLTLGTLHVRNRIVLAPMRQEMADDDGRVNDWHFVHYGARAAGGAGLLLFEACAVEPRGRAGAADIGLWSDEQIAGLSRIVAFCHACGAACAVQLSHAGRKSQLGDAVGASGEPFREGASPPRRLQKREIGSIVAAYHEAAARAVRCGFDTVEIHAAHGTLLHEFLSPNSNPRTDAYGQDDAGRMRFLREVIVAARDVLSERTPLMVRLSAFEAQGDYTASKAALVAKEVADCGALLLDVTSGGEDQTPSERFPGYLLPHAHALSQASGLKTVVGGLLARPELADAALREGRADLVAIGRAFLRDPHWPLHAAEKIGVPSEASVPAPYDLVF